MSPPTEPPSATRPIYLIGAGVVGRAILHAHLAVGLPVRLCDLDEAALEEAQRGCRARFPDLVSHRLPPLGESLPTWALQRSSPVGLPPSNADDGLPPLVIESVVENRQVKQELLNHLETWLGPQALLCSNTSTLQIAGLSERMENRRRCCGMHFFMPVDQRPLVEIVVPCQASKATVEEACRHAQRLGKPILRVADTPGFVVNRLLAPYLNEAMRLLQQGADAPAITAAALAWGMPLSPFVLIDLIGARTVFDAGRVYWQAFPQRIDPTVILPAMLKAKLTGQAAGRGFHRYPAASDPLEPLAPEAAAVVERYACAPRAWSAPAILHRLVLPVLIEAAAILRDGVVDSAEAIDRALAGGLGFRGAGGFFAALERLDRESLLKTWRQRDPQDRALSGGEAVMEAIATGETIEAAVIAAARREATGGNC